MIKLRDLLHHCDCDVYIFGNGNCPCPEIKLPKPLVKAEKYLNADVLNQDVRNIAIYHDHLQIRLENKSIQDVVDSKLKEMEDESNE